jgi:hypothetical protein
LWHEEIGRDSLEAKVVLFDIWFWWIEKISGVDICWVIIAGFFMGQRIVTPGVWSYWATGSYKANRLH